VVVVAAAAMVAVVEEINTSPTRCHAMLLRAHVHTRLL